MTPQQLLLLMGSLMIGMAIAKKTPSTTQDKYIRIALYAFGVGFIFACILWK
jgi:hypothetical protein